jgi:hypothetical protein
MKKITVCLCAVVIFTFCIKNISFAGPITIFNGTAETLPEGKRVIEFHYGYYEMTVIKNTAYWGYARGDDHMDGMRSHDMRFVSQTLTSEVYYAFTDRILVGAIIPYLVRDVKKQPFVNGEEVDSNRFGDIAIRGCLNLFDPNKNFIGATAAGAVVMPSGDEDNDPPTGSGRYEFVAGAVFTKIFDEKFKLHLTLCYKWTTRNRAYKYWGMYSNVDTGDEFHYGIVGEYALLDKLNLVCELNGWAAPESKDISGKKIPYTGYHKVDICPGIQYKLNECATVEAAFNIPLKQDQDFDYSFAPVVGITCVF